jgi:hypothetical protein
MRKIATALTSAALIFGLMVAGASAQDATPEATSVVTNQSPQRDGVSLAIYNVGTALVQDRRTFTFQKGLNTINFTDVAAGIDPTSVTFVSLTDPTGTSVLEQNYVYDLVDSSALVARYIDEKITVITMDGTEYNGTLLSGNGGDIILRQDDGQVVVISPTNIRDIRFPNLPGGLITRPTLRWVIQAAQAGEQQVELTYLTTGMNWAADYNLLLAHDNQSLDLNGWVTLNNTSGGAYTDAQVKLVAGDVNRLPQAQNADGGAVMDMAVAEAAAPPVQQRDFSEYKLYEISRPVTVGANETKQVEFVSAAHVAAHTFYVYDASQPFYPGGSPITDQYYGQNGVTTVANYLTFNTGEESGLGVPLPAGNIRVYQQDTDGSALLIGENSIQHTPKGEDVQLLLGNAFDLVGSRTQTNFKLIASNVLEETYEIHLRNHKANDAVEIRVPEHLFRWSNWEILSSTMDYTKTDSNTIEFRANVPAGGETVITYTVRYTWPQ